MWAIFRPVKFLSFNTDFGIQILVKVFRLLFIHSSSTKTFLQREPKFKIQHIRWRKNSALSQPPWSPTHFISPKLVGLSKFTNISSPYKKWRVLDLVKISIINQTKYLHLAKFTRELKSFPGVLATIIKFDWPQQKNKSLKHGQNSHWIWLWVSILSSTIEIMKWMTIMF